MVEVYFFPQLHAFGYAIQFFQNKIQIGIESLSIMQGKLVNGTKNVLFYNTMQFQRISKNKEPDYCHGNDKKLEIEYFVVNVHI